MKSDYIHISALFLGGLLANLPPAFSAVSEISIVESPLSTQPQALMDQTLLFQRVMGLPQMSPHTLASLHAAGLAGLRVARIHAAAVFLRMKRADERLSGIGADSMRRLNLMARVIVNEERGLVGEREHQTVLESLDSLGTRVTGAPASINETYVDRELDRFFLAQARLPSQEVAPDAITVDESEGSTGKILENLLYRAEGNTLKQKVKEEIDLVRQKTPQGPPVELEKRLRNLLVSPIHGLNYCRTVVEDGMNRILEHLRRDASPDDPKREVEELARWTHESQGELAGILKRQLGQKRLLAEFGDTDMQKWLSVLDVGHSLNNLGFQMEVIKLGILKYLEAPSPSNEQRIELVEEIEEFMKKVELRLSKLLKGLEWLSKGIRDADPSEQIEWLNKNVPGAPLDIEPVNLTSLMRGHVNAFARNKEGVTLSFLNDNGTSDAIINGDVADILNIIENLIGNGVKYNRKGGTLLVHLKPAKDGYLLTFEDQGIGIAEEDIPNLFEIFFRAQSAKTSDIEGSGIGLATVKNLVRKHGGYVHLSSTQGKGTVITVFLPSRP